MASLPDAQMQSVLLQARKFSSEQEGSLEIVRGRRSVSPSGFRQSPFDEDSVEARRLSEAGVNRRPSSSIVLTENTDSFIIGQRVYVDGIMPGRIQFIGETKFGSGDWAGVFLDDALGKNDGSVGKTRYFKCEPKHGIFARLYRLTTQPIEGASEFLDQMRKYGYDLIETAVPSSRRGSTAPEDRRERSSESPNKFCDHVGSKLPGTRSRNGSYSSPGPFAPRRTPPGKSPLASPRNSRSKMGCNIEKDPDMARLAAEARRLSLGIKGDSDCKLHQTSPVTNSNNRRSSEIPIFNKKKSETVIASESRKNSNNSSDNPRKHSSELEACELHQGSILNENTDNLMVGQHVWVDGTRSGRIAYIGEVHFAQGEVAGIHLDEPSGRNNGCVGGRQYFQCEPQRGVFARLHRLTLTPFDIENDKYC